MKTFGPPLLGRIDERKLWAILRDGVKIAERRGYRANKVVLVVAVVIPALVRYDQSLRTLTTIACLNSERRVPAAKHSHGHDKRLPLGLRRREHPLRH